ncbi:MAG: hypothetical protein ACRDRQ_22495 [Pseudonocardiaceae bacterium]
MEAPRLNMHSDLSTSFKLAWDEKNFLEIESLSLRLPDEVLISHDVQKRLGSCDNIENCFAAKRLYRRLSQLEVSRTEFYLHFLERNTFDPVLDALYELHRQSGSIGATLVRFIALYNTGRIQEAKRTWAQSLQNTSTDDLGAFASFGRINSYDSDDSGQPGNDICVLVSRFTSSKDVLKILTRSLNLSFVAWRSSQSTIDAFCKSLGDFGPVSVANPIIEDGNLNEPDIIPYSKLSDTIAGSITTLFEKYIPRNLANFYKNSRDSIELSLSDSIFTELRWRHCLERTVRSRNPQGLAVWCRTLEEVEWALGIADSLDSAIHIYPAFTMASGLRGFPLQPALTREDRRREDHRKFRLTWATERRRLDEITDTAYQREATCVVVGRWEPLSRNVLESVAGKFGSEKVLRVAVIPFSTNTKVDISLSKKDLRIPISPTLESKICSHLESSLPKKLSGLLYSITRVSLNCLERDVPNLALSYDLGRLVTIKTGLANSVICPTRVAMLRAYCHGAQAVGGHTSEIQSVLLSKMPRYRRPSADTFFAIDTYSRDLIIDWFGFSPSDVEIVGDMRNSARPISIEQNLVQLPWREKSVKMIVATQTVPIAQNLALINAIIPLIESRYIDIIVKVHPSEPDSSINAYKSAIENCRACGSSWVLRDVPMSLMLPDADIVISRTSNVALEAAVAGKDVVLLHELDTPMVVPYDKIGVAVVCESPSVLLSAVERILDGLNIKEDLARSRSEYIKNNPLMTHGKGIDVVQNVLLNIKRTTYISQKIERYKINLRSIFYRKLFNKLKRI